MKNYKTPFLTTFLIALTGCSSTASVQPKVEEVSVEERVFGNLEPYAQELLDELRLLAKTRSALAQASKGAEMRRQERMLSTYVIPGFDKRVDWSCGCEIETAMKGIAEIVGYGYQRVFTYGQKPPGGVWVDIQLNDDPIQDALRIIDAEKGAQVEIVVDNKLKTIVIKYLETQV